MHGSRHTNHADILSNITHNSLIRYTEMFVPHQCSTNLSPTNPNNTLLRLRLHNLFKKGIVPVPICHMPISIKTAKAIEQKVEDRGWKTKILIPQQEVPVLVG